VIGEAERVARAEQQHGPAVEHHARALRARDHAQAAVAAELLKLVQSLVEIQHRLSSRTAHGPVVVERSGRNGMDGSGRCRG
jgi:hypothetical protein